MTYNKEEMESPKIGIDRKATRAGDVISN